MSWATQALQWLGQWVAKSRDGANPIKPGLSSDRSLQLDSVKSESLVIANQKVAVNTFSGLVHTASQVTKVGYAPMSTVSAKGVLGNRN